MNLKNNSPCKNCTERGFACWDSCEKYQDWKKEELDKRHEIMAKVKADSQYISYHSKAIYRELKKKNPH